MDISAVLTAASIIAGFGVSVFVFRLQRELEMEAKLEITWIPWADRLVIAAIVLALLGGVLPLVAVADPAPFHTGLARASCSASAVLLVGYVPGILAHYRRLGGRGRQGQRQNPEPAEERWVIGTSIVAVLAFAVALVA